jgi:hypothetical protein
VKVPPRHFAASQALRRAHIKADPLRPTSKVAMSDGFTLKDSPTPMASNSKATEGGVDDLTMVADASSTAQGLAEGTTGSDYRIMTSRATGGGVGDSVVATLHAKEQLNEATWSSSSADNNLLFAAILRR